MKLKALFTNKTPLLNTIDVRKRLCRMGDLCPKFGGVGACEINTQRLQNYQKCFWRIKNKGQDKCVRIG